MKIRDWSAGLFWLFIAAYVCREAMKSGIGSVHVPGPGFVPFLTGIVLAALSCTLLVSATLRRSQGKMSDLWKGLAWSKVIIAAAALFVYCILLPVLGYLIATFGLMVLMLATTKRLNLWLQALVALVITSSSYFIFHTLLGVQLPPAAFGFW